MDRPERIDPSLIPDPPEGDDPPRDELLEVLAADAADTRPLARCGLKIVETVAGEGGGAVVHLLHIATATNIRIDGQAWLIIRPLLLNFAKSMEIEGAADRLWAWVESVLPPAPARPKPGFFGTAPAPAAPARDSVGMNPRQQDDLRALARAVRRAARPS